ncbi:MAG: hypothetical protein LW630_08070, partial [Saprospiraceae bacterium]|nr:hypothetical protein [Saprospiraceae bacterium]
YKRKKSAEILLVLLHYTACGFDFLGLSQLKNTDGLPQPFDTNSNRAGVFTLFQALLISIRISVFTDILLALTFLPL